MSLNTLVGQLKAHKNILLFALAVGLLYFVFGHYLERSSFTKLLFLWSSLCFSSYYLVKVGKNHFWWLVGIGIAVRFIFIGAIPNLSQDFYRFIWDGRLLIQGINPYLFTPQLYAANPEIGVTVSQATALMNGMGALNASHFSNYPPVNQFFFAIAALFSSKSILGSVMVLRCIMIGADIGILYFGKRLLEKLQLPPNRIFWYFLNPFIIIELTGNLHFEGVMLFFMIWGLYLLHNKKWIWAGVLLGLSISVKLLPLLLLPIFLKYFFKKEASFLQNLKIPVAFYLIVLGTVLLTFAPFLSSEFISNFFATISLWFQTFEFNASVYYLIRWIGFQTVGWNIIAVAGKSLAFVVVTIIILFGFFRKNKTTPQLITTLLLGVSCYFLLATTVHPWYVATPLLLSIFTKYKFPLVWSFMIVFSYSAYSMEGFSENLWFVALEYFVVIGFATWELFRKEKEDLKPVEII
ncbi:glycosyltransferase 87 family protein [Ulvibacter litoralis]|uniref:Mannosyltransferase n=1 Tax=Ulvibacter litoralis TaxID=227084 RepID=A0A1G7CK88_9FLAO|nr:glycosyltransferase 87 family protein [Ulvibacter litoralis]GHC47247.1 hypothetical protein GCM10008083_08020 [Ulvibacter litoralis]SDE39096.1 Protein of unknown function [Ulvibacter litoralis]